MDKNYKEIAKIIRNRIELIKTNITKKYQEILLAEMKLLANEFADYFEKEDSKCSRCSKPMKKEFDQSFKREMYYCRTYKTPLVKNIGFNKKQFLKECEKWEQQQKIKTGGYPVQDVRK